MKARKQKLLVAIIDFKDICATFGQNGVISTAIAETLKETLSEAQINEIINHLKRK
ncbi:MAG: hypothetical protein ACOYMA_19075 [Bacteroidia bacterium]